MKRVFALYLLALASTLPAHGQPRSGLPRSSPEAQGVPSSAIFAFLEAAEAKIDALHSFMLSS